MSNSMILVAILRICKQDLDCKQGFQYTPQHYLQNVWNLHEY